jgi:hypothetical protein
MHEDQLRELHNRVTTLETNLQINTDATKRIEANTSDLVSGFASLQGAFKVLQWIGSLAKPIGYIVSAGLAVWGVVLAFKSGISPK